MGDVTTFVAVHDQNTLYNAEQNGTFDSMPHVVWLFLGPKLCFMSHEGKYPIIRAMDFEPDARNLYDFSGFQVLVKHNLIRTKYSVFLQYDHEVVGEGDLLAPIVDKLNSNLGMVTFVPAGYDPVNWMLSVPGFNEAFHRATRACGLDGDWSNLQVAWWPTTQGHAWRSSLFYNFINWASPGLEAVKDEQYAGHIAERLLTVYCSFTHPAQVLTGLFQHNSADVHGTGALMSGDVSTFEQRNAVFGR